MAAFQFKRNMVLTDQQRRQQELAQLEIQRRQNVRRAGQPQIAPPPVLPPTRESVLAGGDIAPGRQFEPKAKAPVASGSGFPSAFGPKTATLEPTIKAEVGPKVPAQQIEELTQIVPATSLDIVQRSIDAGVDPQVAVQAAISAGKLSNQEGLAFLNRRMATSGTTSGTTGMFNDRLSALDQDIQNLENERKTALDPLERQAASARQAAKARTQRRLEGAQIVSKQAVEALATRFGFSGFGQSSAHTQAQSNLSIAQQNLLDEIMAEGDLEQQLIDADLRGASSEILTGIQKQIADKQTQVDNIKLTLLEEGHKQQELAQKQGVAEQKRRDEFLASQGLIQNPSTGGIVDDPLAKAKIEEAQAKVQNLLGSQTKYNFVNDQVGGGFIVTTPESPFPVMRIDPFGNIAGFNQGISIESPQPITGRPITSSRAVRNNNPGNLRSSPLQVASADGFAQFNSMEEGFEALMIDLQAKQTGRSKTGLNERSTLQELISIYAPRADGNDPESYASSVARYLGVDVNTPIGEIPTQNLAREISRHEDQNAFAILIGQAQSGISQELALAEADRRGLQGKEAQQFAQRAMQSGQFPSAGLKPLVQGQLEGLDQARLAKQNVLRIKKLIDDIGVIGPGIGQFRSLNPFDDKIIELNSLIKQTVPGLARGIFKEVGVLTNQDIQNYTKTMANPNLTESQADKLTANLLETIDNSISITLDNLQRANHDVTGFQDLIEPLQAPEEPELEFLGTTKADAEAWLKNIDPKLVTPKNVEFLLNKATPTRSSILK